MAAERLVTFKELRARLAELDKTRKTAERELAALRGHAGHILALERDRDALLDSLAPAQRHHWYKLLRLQAVVRGEGTVKVSWAGGEGSTVCETSTLSRPGAR